MAINKIADVFNWKNAMIVSIVYRWFNYISFYSVLMRSVMKEKEENV